MTTPPTTPRLANRHTGAVLEDEEGLVTAGTLWAELDGRRLIVGPGETVRLPRGVPHRGWNDGDQPLAFEGCTRSFV
jgi:quercetin dioxygenase-like cupin family protein